MKVPPNLTPFDHADQRARHAIIGRDFVVESRIGADGENVRLGQLRAPMPLPIRMFAQPRSISHIIQSRAPAKVVLAVAAFVAVVVADFLTRLTFTMESPCNKPVNVLIRLLARFRQFNRAVSIRPNMRGDNLPANKADAALRIRSLAIQRPDSAKATDFVKPLIAGGRSPYFFHSGKLTDEARQCKAYP